MRGRNKQEMEVDKNLDKLKEEDEEEEENDTHLSGAYIRSFVKKLTASRTKAYPLTNGNDDDDDEEQDVVTNGDDNDEDAVLSNIHRHKKKTKFLKLKQIKPPQNNQQQQQPPPPSPPLSRQHKKQVRRRLHTSRPYQEKILNMAEARKEIVTALKFHRASMKQANNIEYSPSQSRPPNPIPIPTPPAQALGKSKTRKNPIQGASSTSTINFPNYQHNFSYSYCPNSVPPYWVAPPPPMIENFNLPNQTLGLNLNIHEFNNLDTNTLYHSSSSSISNNNYEISTMDLEKTGVMEFVGGEGGYLCGLHQAMDDNEMAEIRSLGEQHEMEWNDKMNLVTSAWWFNYLKTMEIGADDADNSKLVDDDAGLFHPLIDQVMEFPAWLNANESCLQQHIHHQYSNDYSQDPALPCMDIEEIDGMYEEWLA